MEPEVSELPKGLVLGRDENIHLRLRGSTPLGDVARQAEPESSKTAGCKKTRRGTRRKAASQKAEAEKHKESSKATRTTRTTKRVKKSEPQYLEDPRNLQDLWKAAFPVGTNNVYLFGCTEPQLVSVNGENKVVCIRGGRERSGINNSHETNENGWILYIPLENRDSQVDRLKSQIFILGCTKRRFCNQCYVTAVW
ncbi:hypothetical protein FF1_019291 [Malus domestica]